MGVGVFGTGDAAASLLLPLIFTSVGLTPPSHLISAGQGRSPAAASGTQQPAREECRQPAKVARSSPRLSWETGKEAKKAKIISRFFLIRGHGGRRPKPRW